jgi:hypothetical protein
MRCGRVILFCKGFYMLFKAIDVRAGWQLAITFLCVHSIPALAGPPLATGDTDTLDPGHVEVIVAATGDKRDSGDSYELPRFEVSYGLTGNTQAGISFSRAVVDLPGESSKSDFGSMGLEYVWRWYNRDNVTIAVAPAYTFPPTGSSHDRGILDNTRELGIPVIATYANDGWFITGETSYAITSSGPNGIGYGLAAGYEICEKLTGLAEINGGESTGGGVSDQEINWRVGGTYQLADAWTLLFGVGGNLDSDLPGEDQLDQDFFLGLQFNTL